MFLVGYGRQKVEFWGQILEGFFIFVIYYKFWYKNGFGLYFVDFNLIIYRYLLGIFRVQGIGGIGVDRVDSVFVWWS